MREEVEEILDFELWILNWGKEGARFALLGLGDVVESYEE
ncbi:hypothetical protein Clim_1875 [Chlorobium limicola DSM 245]|uniref:Uncharacterized protein n=1 Tax=Chlorobium limicola (strain DSM 245 / NBRC 103803 / 6330) TaxID=290315 RepID=B3EF49_CHLL2|nr:hypothetical protein Clim_1875 [Chlorobium limicola DSM 245]